MSWPAPNEFSDAIQCPQICFSEQDLRGGQVINNHLGLPAVSSGNFASVYSLRLANKRVAVRCFNRSISDHAHRYDEISRQLHFSNLDCMVEFRFVAEGILVNGEWFPIVRMEWIDGEPFLNYIEKNLSDPPRLLSLAQKWMLMSRNLQNACIAHGDLQHGNIIVRNDELKLIDYDGMYVPALDGLRSNESGLRNYQHPARTNQFGPHLDNFSAWIIYGSLMCLSLDPSLWQQSGRHDDCLLFQEADYLNPDDSVILNILKSHPNVQVQSIGAQLHALMKMDLESIPSLANAAPLPVAQNVDLLNVFKMLGLSSDASSEDIRLASAVFAKVWETKHYRKDLKLLRRAERKLFELENGIKLCESLISASS